MRGEEVEAAFVRAVAISDEMEVLGERIASLSRERRAVLVELNAAGFSGYKIAVRLGMTRSRVLNILREPEAEFWGQRGPRAARDR